VQEGQKVGQRWPQASHDGCPWSHLRFEMVSDLYITNPILCERACEEVMDSMPNLTVGCSRWTCPICTRSYTTAPLNARPHKLRQTRRDCPRR
jgi:hypothetical protein